MCYMEAFEGILEKEQGMFPKIRLDRKSLIHKNTVNYSIVNLTRFPNVQEIEPVNSL